jgi:hypothetical protein
VLVSPVEGLGSREEEEEEEEIRAEAQRRREKSITAPVSRSETFILLAAA